MLTIRRTDMGKQRFSAHISGTETRSIVHAGYTFNDTFFALLRNLEYYSPVADPYSKLSLPVPDFQEGQEVIPGTPPRTKLNALRNSTYTRYSVLADSIKSMFLDGWNFHNMDYKVPNEKPVLHHNCVGVVDLGGSHDSHYSIRQQPDPSSWQNIDEVYDSFIVTNLGPDIYNISPVMGVDSDIISDPITGDVLLSIDNLVQEANDGSRDVSTGSTRSYVFDAGYYITNDESVVVYYGWVIGRKQNPYWNWDVIYTRVTFSGNFDVNTISTDVEYSCSLIWQPDVLFEKTTYVSNKNLFYSSTSVTREDLIKTVHLNFLPTSAMSGDWTGYPNYSSRSLTHVGPYFTHPPSDDGRIYEMIKFDRRAWAFDKSNTPEKSFLHFHQLAEKAYPLCAAGNFVSSMNAIDSLFGSLGTNMIEFALESRELVAPLNMSILIAKMIKERKNPGFSGLLDLLTDAKLLYSFGIAPNVSLAQEVAENGKSLKEKITNSDLFKPQTAYGKAAYPLDDVDFLSAYPGTYATMRSKVRLGLNTDSLLPYLMPVHSLGFLPTLSNIWDTLPGSFLVDWAFDIGSRLELIDNQALAWLFEIEYSTHSINIVYDFTDEDENEYSFSKVRSDESGEKLIAGYKLYGRYVLNKALPTLGPTVLPIIRTSLWIPDWGTAGSLLYKFR